ncbi:MAG: prepilin-type N-terminal cleavage/methylation domain-containing protein [Trueperaceae bacterium]|nr:prepilin-type N-terminal cleavage/methylation domain-containing protein [Trueperaceae bacterium]
MTPRRRTAGMTAGRMTNAGMTLVEMLIAMTVFAVVLLITSSGIVTALRVNRVVEEATSSQAKLRRIVEVQTQELRGAVMGAIADFPVRSDGDSISFGLLLGDRGLTVENRPGVSWGAANNTFVSTSDPDQLDSFVGHPAVMVNGDDQALVIPVITGAPAGDRLNHNGCKISIPYVDHTRLYRLRAVGIRYDSDDRTLYQVEFDAGERDIVETPIAFDMTEVVFRYEYASGGDTVVLDTPRRDARDRLLTTYDEGGSTYELVRLQLTLGTEASEGRGQRTYVSHVEMRGQGNDFRLSSPQMCDDDPSRGGRGGPPDDPTDPPADPDDPGDEPDEPEEPKEPKEPGNGGGGAGDDDDDEDDDDQPGRGPVGAL